MKSIGLLGGTGWSSTIEYYKLLNEAVNQRLGGYHSASIILKSIDYNNIMTNYGHDHAVVSKNLKHELVSLFNLKPDCFMICCNSLHKYYDLIKRDLPDSIPILHAINLTAEYLVNKKLTNVLLLATKFTLEDGFFSEILEHFGINVTIPDLEQRNHMHSIHHDLMQNNITEEGKAYFRNLVAQYKDLDAVILGCTEFPMVLNQADSILPVINPVHLQVKAAVDFSLNI